MLVDFFTKLHQKNLQLNSMKSPFPSTVFDMGSLLLTVNLIHINYLVSGKTSTVITATAGFAANQS